MRTYIAALIVLIGTLGTAHADKKQHRFVGIHPIPKTQGGGVCHIQAPHVHIYAPADLKVQYRDHDGWSYFVGDPVAYGWDGPRYSYYGHHPVPVDVIVEDDHDDTEYCYLDGPHFHAWAPPADLKLELRGGAYWYVGDFPPAYAEARVTYDPIDVVYQPIRYERPTVVVDAAPPGWYGAVVVAPVVVAPARVDVRPARVRAGVEVHVPAPVLRVEIGVPSVQIGIGGGVVVHEHRGHAKYKGRKHGRGHR
ncbi:MAG: hypothetical protein IPL61_06320 [Myxococcales bacterium]|nr:hypothetical protein [Myxococcales bacterium]